MTTLTKAIERVVKVADSHYCLNDELRDSMRIVASKARYSDNDKDEIKALKDLIHHAWLYSGYENCGYDKMDGKQRELYDAVRSEISEELNQ